MAKGFIVARIKYSDRSIFHCMDGEKKNRLYLQEDLLSMISEGRIVNGFVCKGEMGDYIRLAEGVPVVVRPMSFDLMDFCSFIPGYFGQGGPAKVYTQKALNIAAKRELAGGRIKSSDFERKSKSVANCKPAKHGHVMWGSNDADYYVDVSKSSELYSCKAEFVNKMLAFVKMYTEGDAGIDFTLRDKGDGLPFHWNEVDYDYEALPFSKHGRDMVYWIVCVLKNIYMKERVNSSICFKLKSGDRQRDWALCFTCNGKETDIEGVLVWKPQGTRWSHSKSAWSKVSVWDEEELGSFWCNSDVVDMEQGVTSFIVAYLLYMWTEYRDKYGI